MSFDKPTAESPSYLRGVNRSRKPRTLKVTSPERLKAVATSWQEDGYSIYAALNEARSDYQGESPNTPDIAKRTRIAIDTDPIREPDTASSDEQREESRKLSLQIKEFLQAEGFPEPTHNDSGNGDHLIYNCDWPADAESTALVSSLYVLLNRLFPNDAVKVDERISDLPRILRLPGFWNKKAEPYRLCETISEGSDELLSIETVRALLAKHDQPINPAPEFEPAGEPNEAISRNAKAWAESHGFQAKVERNKLGYAVRLNRCPLNADNHSSTGTSPDLLVIGNKLSFKCHGDHCKGQRLRDLETVWGQSFAEFMGDTPPQVRGIAQAVDDPNRIATEWKRSLTVDYVPGIVIVDDELWFREGERWTQPTPAKLSSMATARCQKEFNDDFLRRQSEAATVASIGDGKSVDSIRATPAAVKPAKKTSKSLSANVIDSLRSIVPELPRNGQQMIGHSVDDADDIRRLANVDLNVRKYINGGRDAVTPHAPQLFTRSIIDCEWDPEATAPVWEAFLASLKLTDDEMRFLRQAIAYVAFPIELLEKYFMHVGPTRCGKKVVFEILMMLCGGPDAAVSIDFRDFASEFGLQETPGKRLVLVPEATMSDKNLPKAVQRIKAWTGGDAIPINRKNKAPLSEKLDAVIWMSSNERLALRDDSSALQARQLLIQFRESFFGREDIQLSKKLRNELPGILLWALDGLKDLKENDWRFAIPESWKEAAEDLARDSMPVRSFIADCFDPAPGERTPINEVKNLYTDWSDQEISDAKLIRELKAAPFKVTRPWEKDEHGRRPTYLHDFLPSTGA